MSSNSPLARVKEEFGGKDKLVDKLVGLVDAGDESKDDLRKRLLGAANNKLLKLHSVATRVKERGGRDKLVVAAATSVGHGKDKDFVGKLEAFGDARLLDILQVAERRTARKSKAAAAPKAAKAPKAEKAPAAKSAKPAGKSAKPKKA
jgi:hypothetical protein